jgi:hypothetical protein
MVCSVVGEISTDYCGDLSKKQLRYIMLHMPLTAHTKLVIPEGGSVYLVTPFHKFLSFIYLICCVDFGIPHLEPAG